MCEIAVYDPAELDTEGAFDLAFDMFQSNNDGLGALAVYKNDEQFEYEPFAQAEPSWGEFMNFLLDREDDAWRVILHARLSTTGADNDQNTHPLEVGEGADFDWVVHNGVVSNHPEIKAQAEQAGHSYATDVDSESIAHCVGELPESIEDIDTDNEYHLQGRLNYILCNEDGIFVHNTGKYEWSEDFKMLRCYRRLDFEDTSEDIKWMILRPDGDVSTIEKQRSSSVTVQGTRSGGYWSRGNFPNGDDEQTHFQEEGSSEVIIGEDDVSDDVGTLFNEDGELIAWWEDESEKFTTDYDQYKAEYGGGNDEVEVFGDEIGKSSSPDGRVPERATGMYVGGDGERIDWWAMEEGLVDNGFVQVDTVVMEAEIENHETLFDLPEGEDEEGNACQRKSGGKSSKSKKSESKKSGSGYATVNGVTYTKEDLEIWDGHYGPRPEAAE